MSALTSEHSNAPDIALVQKGAQLRIEGKSFSVIATELGVKNTTVLRNAISNVIRASQAEISADVELILAMDLARYEMIFQKAAEYGMQGSDKHLNIMLKALKERRDAMEMWIGIQRDAAGAQDDAELYRMFTTDSPEFERAQNAINASYYVNEDEQAVSKKKPKRNKPGWGESENDYITPNSDLIDKIPEDMRDAVRDQLFDLQLDADRILNDDDEDEVDLDG